MPRAANIKLDAQTKGKLDEKVKLSRRREGGTTRLHETTLLCGVSLFKNVTFCDLNFQSNFFLFFSCQKCHFRVRISAVSNTNTLKSHSSSFPSLLPLLILAAIIPFTMSASSTIYIGNLPSHLDESSLSSYFHPFGDIVSISVPSTATPTGKRNKGFGFITFSTPDDALTHWTTCISTRSRGGRCRSTWLIRARSRKGCWRGRTGRAVWTMRNG